MLGTFQQSHLRIEVPADGDRLERCLLYPATLRQWIWPQQLPLGLPERFHAGLRFSSTLGPATIHHEVDTAEGNCLRWLLGGSIDGFHEWYWGDGWIQSRLEGVSFLPLKLGQTLALMRLREFLQEEESPVGQ